MKRDICRWDHPEDYKYTDNHDLRDWGWEFIRRNPLYIKKWTQRYERFHIDEEWRLNGFCYLCQIDFPSIFPDKEKLILVEGFTDNGGAIFKNPDEINRRMTVYKEHGYNFTNPEEYETFEMFAYIWPNWGIVHYQDPDAKRLAKCNKLITTDPLQRLSIPGPETTEYSRNISIDLSRPISSQIENIKRLAEIEQKKYKEYSKKTLGPVVIDTSKRSKPQVKDLWKTYIRCLDAYGLGVKGRAAADVLFNENLNSSSKESQWKEKLRQAKDMVKTGFMSLMF